MGRKSLGGHRPRSGDAFFKVGPNWERDKNKSDRIAKVLAQRDRNLPVRWGGEGKKVEEELGRHRKKTPWSKMHSKERKEDELGTKSASAR